ncbi:MAG: hypothetical protein NC123_08285 [Butyrivibrio sp.]|nr:hypothetical protein [Acetatifactor muris]MCM1559528.1 hypothetical protein [Butyrivibrio sp.]
MYQELKISLPPYKVAFALFFIGIFSLIRGVSVSYEAGAALEPALAILTTAFCADTYVQEITGRRSEIWRLYPMRKKLRAVGSRLLIQEVFLLLLAATGYGLIFLFQRPLLSGVMHPETGTELQQFLLYLGAMLITLAFWSVLSNTIACLFGNLWFGIGGCLILWLVTGSAFGQRILGAWNVFSYTFRNVKDINDLSWLTGKAVCVLLCALMLLLLPALLKKRSA